MSAPGQEQPFKQLPRMSAQRRAADIQPVCHFTAITRTDPARREMGIAPPPGNSVFRILELPAGKDAFMHCTDTIDYCIVMEGVCVMLLDDGA